MAFKIRIVREKDNGRLKFSHGGVKVYTKCWWNPTKIVEAGTYSGFATRMATTKGGFDGGKLEAIWLGKNVLVNGQKSDNIFIHKGTGPSSSKGGFVADGGEVLKIWQAITPKERQNVTIEVISLAGEKARIQQQIIKEHDIVERDTWGATGPWKNFPLIEDWAFDTVVVHHSGNWGVKTPLGIGKKHKKEGYDDVGYHYMIHPNGTIYEGRQIIHKGEHVGGANTKKIGILMMGDYDEQFLDDDDELTQHHLQTFVSLVRTLQRHFPLTTLGGHREFLPDRPCPGNLLMGKMDELRTDLGLKPGKPVSP